MRERTPTLHDVAREAGVSTATVSRVLNGASVRRETADLVRDAVSRLGYVPNRLARDLVTGRSDIVGVLVPDLVGPLNAAVARGVEDALDERGLQSFVTAYRRDPERERQRLGTLVARRVDGLVLIGSVLEDAVVRSLVGAIPVVHVGAEREPRDDGGDVPEVRIDNRAGIDAALERLARAGHRRIAQLSGPRRDGREREAAIRERAPAHGLELVACEPAEFSESGGFEAGRRLLAREEEIHAVLCANDRNAVGLYAAARERGLRLPDDLSIIGFDDLPWSAYLEPALTTVRQPSREMGRLATERLFARDAAEAWNGIRTLQPDLIDRASVASPSPADPHAVQRGSDIRPPTAFAHLEERS